VVRQQTVAAAARSRIVTAQVSLRVADVAAAVGVATRLTTGAGGYVADSKQVAAPAGDRQQPTGPSATVTLRVPPERLTGVLDQVARLGTVTDSRRTEADVTSKVADLDARLRTQQVSLQRLRGLFARAGTLSEITALEQALTAREAELESTQAQRKALAGQVDDATVTLDVLGPADTVRAAAPGGFGPGLRAGWSALGGTVRVGSTVIGALLPFLPIAAVGRGVGRVAPTGPPQLELTDGGPGRSADATEPIDERPTGPVAVDELPAQRQLRVVTVDRVGVQLVRALVAGRSEVGEIGRDPGAVGVREVHDRMPQDLLQLGSRPDQLHLPVRAPVPVRAVVVPGVRTDRHPGVGQPPDVVPGHPVGAPQHHGHHEEGRGHPPALQLGQGDGHLGALRVVEAEQYRPRR